MFCSSKSQDGIVCQILICGELIILRSSQYLRFSSKYTGESGQGYFLDTVHYKHNCSNTYETLCPLHFINWAVFVMNYDLGFNCKG